MDLDFATLPTCTRCDLSLTRQRVVIGSGPLHAALVVVGEAPGRAEDEGGEPFVGRSGRLLFQLIDEEIGLARSACFVTNAVKCRPPMNRPPRQRELDACRPWLLAQLGQARAPVVLALGATAARAVFGLRESIGDVHGRVRDLGLARGVVTYHPAAALRAGPRVLEVLRADLRVVRALVHASRGPA